MQILRNLEATGSLSPALRILNPVPCVSSATTFTRVSAARPALSFPARARRHRGRKPRHPLPAGSRSQFAPFALRRSTAAADKILQARSRSLSAKCPFKTRRLRQSDSLAWPITSKHQISLRWNAKKPRGAQLVVVHTPEGPLHLVNFHLGLGDAERCWQIEHLLNHHLFHESAKLSTLLIGDYNDWRNCLHRGLLNEHGFQQITAPISRFRSFPAYMALSSLDKAFVRGAVLIRHARVVRNYLTPARAIICRW